MSLTAPQRRDQRRRLVVSWNRSTDTGSAVPADTPRVMAAYDPEAHPEKQRGPAVLLPTGLGGLSIAIVAILVPLAAALAAAAAEHAFGRQVFVGGGRFARTLAAAGSVLDATSVAALPIWLGQMFLVIAAAVALVVRLMRRHRRDDYKGRFRAWGWMAAILLLTACSGAVPLGRLVGAAMADATGVTFGPRGLGWWIGLATVAFSAVSLWAVLPLHERIGTAVWLTLALVTFGASAAAAWLADGRPAVVAAGLAAWSLGGALALVAMLAAARSVIREVRGQCGRPARTKPVREKVTVPSSPDADDAAAEAEAVTADDGATLYTDGSDHDQRHMSKAERKRLRKLARMNGAAA
jgi:hypothetical protein